MLLQGNNEKVRMGNAFLQKQLPLFTSGVMCNEGLIDCCTLKPQTSSLGKKERAKVVPAPSNISVCVVFAL